MNGMSTAVGGLLQLGVLVCGVAGGYYSLEKLERVAEKQKIKFNLIELLVTIISFGVLMSVISTCYGDLKDRIAVWAAYVVICGLFQFLLCLDIFRRTTLQHQDRRRIVILALAIVTCPVTLLGVFAAWLNWKDR